MLTAMREAFAGLGRAVLRLPTPVVADAPLPDPLREEMDELARARQRRRWQAWRTHCHATGTAEVGHMLYSTTSDEPVYVEWRYPPMPETWDAPAR